MLAGCQELVDGLRIGEHHERETARNAGVGIDLHRDALDLAELAEMIPELLVGGVAGQAADEELTLIVLAGDAGGRLLLRRLRGRVVLLLILLLMRLVRLHLPWLILRVVRLWLILEIHRCRHRDSLKRSPSEHLSARYRQCEPVPLGLGANRQQRRGASSPGSGTEIGARSADIRHAWRGYGSSTSSSNGGLNNDRCDYAGLAYEKGKEKRPLPHHAATIPRRGGSAP